MRSYNAGTSAADVPVSEQLCHITAHGAHFDAHLLRHHVRQREHLAATERQHILPCMVLLSADAS